MRILTLTAALTLALVHIAQAQYAPIPQPSTVPGASAPNPIINTPRGSDVTTGGTQGYQQLTTPGGAAAIGIPNSNGTSTITTPNGGVQTVPSAR